MFDILALPRFLVDQIVQGECKPRSVHFTASWAWEKLHSNRAFVPDIYVLRWPLNTHIFGYLLFHEAHMCSLWTSKRVAQMSHFSFQQTHYSPTPLNRVHSETYIIRRFHRCVNLTERHKPRRRAYCTPQLCGTAHCSWAAGLTAHCCTKQQEITSSTRENNATRGAVNTRRVRQPPV